MPSGTFYDLIKKEIFCGLNNRILMEGEYYMAGNKLS